MDDALRIATAIVSALNAAAFSVPLTAVRLLAPLIDLSEIGLPVAVVVPRGVMAEIVDRNSMSVRCEIDVAIQQKAGSETDLEDLVSLSAEVTRWLERRRLDEAPDATWIGETVQAMYVPDHYHELRRCTSLVTHIYEVRR